MKCLMCEGEGGWIEHIEGSTVISSDCPLCEGSGILGFRKWLHNLFWRNAPVWLVEWQGDRREI